MQRDIVAAVIATVRQVYDMQNRPWPDDPDALDSRYRMFRSVLEPMADEEGKWLVWAINNLCEFPPTPANLARLVRNRRSCSEDATKALAWVMDKKQSHGVFALPSGDKWIPGEPQYENPLVEAVIQSFGGWVAFCERPWREADMEQEFLSRYREAEKAQAQQSQMGRGLYLPGTVQKQLTGAKS